jgi:hypothetical protein
MMEKDKYITLTTAQVEQIERWMKESLVYKVHDSMIQSQIFQYKYFQIAEIHFSPYTLNSGTLELISEDSSNVHNTYLQYKNGPVQKMHNEILPMLKYIWSHLYIQNRKIKNDVKWI